MPFSFRCTGTSDFAGCGVRGTLGMSVTVGGVPWSNGPTDAFSSLCNLASASGRTNRPVTGPGIYSGTFDFFASFTGAPASEFSAHPGVACGFPPSGITCTQLGFSGGGIGTFDMVGSGCGNPDGPFNCRVEGGIFTFQTPEPSTTSLLLVAFAGLAIAGGRRKFLARWFPAG